MNNNATINTTPTLLDQTEDKCRQLQVAFIEEHTRLTVEYYNAINKLAEQLREDLIEERERNAF